MTTNPCSVCGGKDLNLIDGFYYCVECGTQDVNAQETVVEHTILADGTFAHVATRKITKVLKDAIQMSGEWHKWHTFNFILAGLVDELVGLGASNSFRDKVLWIWTRYMKEFMDKDQMGTITEIKAKEEIVHNKSIFECEEEPENSKTKYDSNQIDDENDSSDDDLLTIKSRLQREKDRKIQREKNTKKMELDRNSIKIVTKGLLVSILYVALNLDRCDIQLSHLLRFIREGRLSITKCKKFIPNELDLKSISHWKNFMSSNKEQYYSSTTIRQTAMSLIKVLGLGTPLVPNLRNIAENHVKELCLPNEFKNLVFSLMHQVPCDCLDVDNISIRPLVRTPDYEGVVMSYVLLALKMTFGLDDHYEVALSEAVEKINEMENHPKSYKLGGYSEPTERLLSFNEWSRYLQFRKIMLCKHYLPMALQNNLDVDDKVFIEHLEERQTRKKLLSDQVTMDILERIVTTDEGSVIPKSEFATTLSPLVDYTEVILMYIQDPDVKLLISEDFTQYSLKYACEELRLLNDEKNNLIIGINEKNKTINKVIVGNLISNEYDYSSVIVRYCDNKNWLKTKPPTVDHITKVDEICTEENSDQGYESHLEVNSTDVNNSHIDDINEELKELETIEEEKEGVSIFDDQFNNIEDLGEEDKPECNNFQFDNDNFNSSEMENDQGKSINDECDLTEAKFNLDTFNRERTIKELVLIACKKYKISIPEEYNPNGPIKRKRQFISDETGEMVPKKYRRRTETKRGDAQEEVDGIMASYYANIEKELLEKVSEHLNTVMKDLVESQVENTPDDEAYNVTDCNLQSFTENEQEIKVQNDEFATTADSSVIEVQTDLESVTDEFLPKVNPDFDEKTHDVKQLYIKCNQDLPSIENLILNDEDTDKIIVKKIKEYGKNEFIKLCIDNLKSKTNQKDVEESEYDDFFQSCLLQRGLKLEPLVNNAEEMEFKHWQRHYTSLFMRKNTDRREKFDKELNENFPISFIFVVKECAAILDCSGFSLYKHFQCLERTIFR